MEPRSLICVQYIDTYIISILSLSLSIYIDIDTYLFVHIYAHFVVVYCSWDGYDSYVIYNLGAYNRDTGLPGEATG